MANEVGEQPVHQKYRILMELGEGGTAHVFLAVAQGPSGFNKLVVLKALKQTLSGDEEFRRMFMNEARLSARLNHPNIVEVNEVIEQDGVPVIVMQYLEGRPLLEIINRAGARFERALHLRIISESLSGLHYLHELCDFDGTPLEVVHRDMTPHNVFVTFDGRVKLLDFGIAKLSGSIAETREGVLKGKLRYMPPEQIMGEQVDRRTDIYAVGVMLWEAATGHKMWHSLSEATIMNRVLEGRVPSPSSEAADVHPELERLVMKSLANDPSDRYPAASDLQRDLESFLDSEHLMASSREIGAFVSTVFADYRREIRKGIEDNLAQNHALALSESGSISIAPHSPVNRQSRDLLEPGSYFWRKSVSWLALTGAILVGIAIFIGNNRVRRKSASALEVPSNLVTMGPNAESNHADAPRTIKLHVSATPSDASLSVDGKVLPQNPSVLSAAADGTTHTVKIEARDHQTRTITVTYDRDQDIVVALDRNVGSESTFLKVPRAARASPPPGTSVPPAKSDDCSPPYFLDDRGIKHFKKGCI